MLMTCALLPLVTFLSSYFWPYQQRQEPGIYGKQLSGILLLFLNKKNLMIWLMLIW